MTSTVTPSTMPLPLDQIPTEAEFYGVKLVMIGEDGDTIAVFTHDEPRAVAAVNRYVREYCKGHAEYINSSAPCWWQVIDNSGDGEWNYQDCEADAPGAVPVTVCEVGY